MQWNDLVADLSYYLQQEQPDPSFSAATPNFVNMAELKIYRALMPNAFSGQNLSLQTVAQSKVVDLTQMMGQVIDGGSAVQRVWPIVTEGIAARVGNRWIPYVLSSLAWIDSIWPDLTQFAPPALGLAYYTMLDDQTAILAPVPDMVYPLRITGQWRPAPMSPTNPRTWLGDNASDVLFAGVVLEALGYQRDFGSAPPDPQAAVSWRTRFNEALQTLVMEENLKKGMGPDYQPFPPAPLARPQPAAPPQ